MFPYLPRAIRMERWQNFAWYDVTNPYETLSQLWSGNRPYAALIFLLLGAAAATMVLINVPAMIRAARATMVRAEPAVETDRPYRTDSAGGITERRSPRCLQGPPGRLFVYAGKANDHASPGTSTDRT